MAKLVYAMNTSLDGYVTDRAGRIDWAVSSPELFAAILELQRPIGTYLYGRKLYETMAVWNTAHVRGDEPAFTPGILELERAFAAMWRAADKIVFSTTLTEPTTPRTRITTFDPDEVRRLKATSDRDLGVGGPHLAAAMIAADLVDEFHAFVHPISIGGGNAWLPPDRRVALELVGDQRLGDVVHLHYRLG